MATTAVPLFDTAQLNRHTRGNPSLQVEVLSLFVAEVERLISIGAVRYPWRYRPGSDFVVLEDPDGNLFCVVQKDAIQ